MRLFRPGEVGNVIAREMSEGGDLDLNGRQSSARGAVQRDAGPAQLSSLLYGVGLFFSSGLMLKLFPAGERSVNPHVY